MSALDEIRAAERRVEILRLEHALAQFAECVVYDYRITLSCLNGTVDVMVTKDDMRGLIERQLAALYAEADHVAQCNSERYSVTDRDTKRCTLPINHLGDHQCGGKQWLD